MRDKNFDVDLLKTLNDQPMPETPLTDDEFTRVLDAACGRLPQKKPAGHRRLEKRYLHGMETLQRHLDAHFQPAGRLRHR